MISLGKNKVYLGCFLAKESKRLPSYYRKSFLSKDSNFIILTAIPSIFCRRNDSVYADFDLDVGEVCDALTVIQVCGDGSEETYRYPLTEEDRSILRAKMNDYCMEQTGLSLDDYRAQYLDEDMCASSFPDGQSM